VDLIHALLDRGREEGAATPWLSCHCNRNQWSLLLLALQVAFVDLIHALLELGREKEAATLLLS
jgi:hypothetical protein